MLRSQIISIVIYGKKLKANELELIGRDHNAVSPRTSEAHAVWRECGQVSALLQFIYPLVDAWGTLCLGMTLPDFHTSCNHVHFAFHTS